MWYLTVLLAVLHSTFVHGNNLLEQCAKYYSTKNYLDMLPSINMPYIDQLPIPNNLKNVRNKDYMSKIQNIVPTPMVTTKVVAIKTKYVLQNPVCVKYSKNQPVCKPEDGKIRENVDMLVTKEYFFKNNVEERVDSVVGVVPEESDDVDDDRFSLKVSFNNKLEASEPAEPKESRAFDSRYRTPSMDFQKMNELLIEDRLDQLETILPDYHRRRTYETSTMYVTKTMTNKRRMATLVVKNCIPVGYDVCTKKRKARRSSKVAKRAFDSGESQFYFG